MMRTEVKNFIVLMIVIRVNLVDQSSFDLRSPLNGCRDYEIIISRKFNVVDTQNRIRCIVMEATVTEIKWRLNSRIWR